MFIKKLLRTVLFALGGAGAALIYYYVFTCDSGCAITSSPTRTMLVMAAITALASMSFGGEESKEG